MEVEQESPETSDWLTDLKEKEEEYSEFYQHDVEEIKVFFFFVNKENVINKISEEIVALEEVGVLKKEQIITLIHDNITHSGIKYNLDSLLKYNITLEPLEIKNFIEKDNDPNFLKEIESINDTYFEKTITSFYDLNSLFIIFKEAPQKLKTSNTRRMSVKSRNRKTRKTV